MGLRQGGGSGGLGGRRIVEKILKIKSMGFSDTLSGVRKKRGTYRTSRFWV